MDSRLILALLLAPLLLAPPAWGAPRVKGPLRIAAVPPADKLGCSQWNPRSNCVVLPDGTTRRVTLNARGGAGLLSPKHYMNGIFSLSIKLPPGNTTSVVYAWYLMDTLSKSNKDANHSEIDIEIYGGGNATQAMLATNIFCNGSQNLVQFNLSFDPSAAFHSYGIRWNSRQIVWSVDDSPIRILNRHDGEPWPVFAMKPMASIWQAGWIKQGRINRNTTSVSAYYGNYTASGCEVQPSDTQKPGVQCPGPWNWGLTPAQFDAYRDNRRRTLLKDYGWDKA